jgi:hypothetical protein
MVWIVEEVNNETGSQVYYESFNDYDSALTAYDNRKNAKSSFMNTISLVKSDKKRVLLEDSVERVFLKD